VAALLSGRAQFAVVAGAAVVAAMAHGAKLKMVASFMNRPVFIAMAVPSIRTAAQLPGTTWAVTSLGSADDFDLQAMFSYLKVPQSSVHIVPAGSVPAQLAMVEAGRAQGIVVSLPNNIIAEEKAGMHQFLNFEQMGVKEQNLGIVTTDAFAQQHPRTVVRFIEACVQGMNRFAQDRAFGYQVMKQYFHYTDPRVLAASYQFERNLWPRELYPTAAGTQRDIGEVATRDPAAKSVTPQDVITRKFVNQVVAAGYVYTGAQAATTGSAKGAAAGGGTGQSG
jgi:ABC-type nitrate/sulfonate/bicarbonate transport system substrate-binding protein